MRFLATLTSILLVVAITAAGILFALQNSTRVPLDILVYTFEPRSLALWVLGAFAVGGGVGLLVSSGLMFRQHAALASRDRQLRRARDELDKLRGGVAG